MHEQLRGQIYGFCILSSKPQLQWASAVVVVFNVNVDVVKVVVGVVPQLRFGENCNLIQIGWLGRQKIVVVVKLTLLLCRHPELSACGAEGSKPLTRQGAKPCYGLIKG